MNINVANTGLWRLTSSAENNKRRTTGVTFVNVRGRYAQIAHVHVQCN